MCWPFLMDVISCPMWSDNTWGPESVSKLSLGGQRSPFSFRVIQMIPVSSSVRDSSYIIVVSTLLLLWLLCFLVQKSWMYTVFLWNALQAVFKACLKLDSWGLPLLTKPSWVTYFKFLIALFCAMQRLSQMIPALLSPKLILAGSAHPTFPLWEAVCWPISANQDMTSVALTSSPASGTSPGAAVHLRVWKVRQMLCPISHIFIVRPSQFE